MSLMYCFCVCIKLVSGGYDVCDKILLKKKINVCDKVPDILFVIMCKLCNGVVFLCSVYVNVS